MSFRHRVQFSYLGATVVGIGTYAITPSTSTTCPYAARRGRGWRWYQTWAGICSRTVARWCSTPTPLQRANHDQTCIMLEIITTGKGCKTDTDYLTSEQQSPLLAQTPSPRLPLPHVAANIAPGLKARIRRRVNFIGSKRCILMFSFFALSTLWAVRRGLWLGFASGSKSQLFTFMNPPSLSSASGSYCSGWSTIALDIIVILLLILLLRVDPLALDIIVKLIFDNSMAKTMLLNTKTKLLNWEICCKVSSKPISMQDQVAVKILWISSVNMYGQDQ